MPTEILLEQIEREIRREFPNVLFEFERQGFENHIELWVYVLSITAYEDVKQMGREIATNQNLDAHSPAIWIIVRTWSGPWPGGDSESDLRKAAQLERRRDEVRQKLSSLRA